MRPFVVILILIFKLNCLSQQRYEFNLFFETDKSELKIAENQKIDSVMNLLDVNKIYEINIHAYCDDRADSIYNVTLSEKRADYVKTFFNTTLKNKRIRTKAHAMGEIPLTTNQKIESQRDFNRRATVEILTLPPNNINRIEFAQVGEKVILQNILFEANRHQLLENSKPTLDSITQFLIEKPTLKFKILGHICCRKKGSLDATDDDTGERGLSENRAKYIFLYFKAKGIDPNRMGYKGMKADFPLGKGDHNDRRVELEIIEK